jgi:hypothetical protein
MPCCSYFAIFGNLFGFKNFGKLVAADNIFNSLFGLLQVGRKGSWWTLLCINCRTAMHDTACTAMFQKHHFPMPPPPPTPPPPPHPQYPLAYLGLHHGFTWINVGQAVVLLPLFFFSYYMFCWENSDLVPIR